MTEVQVVLRVRPLLRNKHVVGQNSKTDYYMQITMRTKDNHVLGCDAPAASGTDSTNV
jgi:hypothetical protein